MMGRLSAALVLVALAGAGLLVACDNDEEEAAEDGMSASEVLDRANQALLTVTSVRTETASIDGGFPAIDIPEFGTMDAQPPEASFSLTIEDGSGRRYTQDLAPPEGSCVELNEECLAAILSECRSADADCVEGSFSESLWVGETEYHRDANGAWSDADERCDENGCWGISVAALDHVLEESCGPSPSSSPTPTPAVSLGYLLSSMATDYERLDDHTIDGVTLIHLRGDVFDPWKYTPPPGCPTPIPEELLPTSAFDVAMREWLPNRFGGYVEVWIDPVTYLPVRTLQDFGVYNDDRELSRNVSLSVYSDFNTAEIPGPLP
jgi:hypothetical protein